MYIYYIAGSDYNAVVSEELIFTSLSSQRQCITIGIIDDQDVEQPEQLTVRIDQSTLQGPVSNQAAVIITDSMILFSAH